MSTLALSPTCHGSYSAKLPRSGEWKQAIQLIQRMKEQGLKPQTRTYNSAINACLGFGRGNAWLSTFIICCKAPGLPQMQSRSCDVSSAVLGSFFVGVFLPRVWVSPCAMCLFGSLGQIEPLAHALAKVRESFPWRGGVAAAS